MSDLRLSVEQINRYLSLVERRLYIVMHSGVDWKPEYIQELQDIDEEIAVLREIIDAAHEGRQVQEDGLAVPREVSYQEYSRERATFFKGHGNGYDVHTSGLSDLVVYHKEYAFPDGAVWYERVSPVTEDLSIRSHGIDIPLQAKFSKTEFWDTDCPVSRYCYELF